MYKRTVGIMSTQLSPPSLLSKRRLYLAGNVAGMLDITFEKSFRILKSALDPCVSGSRFDYTC